MAFEIEIDINGQVRGQFKDFRPENPACSTYEVIKGMEQTAGLEVQDEKFADRGHGHTHTHADGTIHTH